MGSSCCCRLVVKTLCGIITGGIMVTSAPAADSAPSFFRGLNLNGPAVTIDGHAWEGQDSKHYVCRDKAFENQSVPLVPATDPERTKMLRSSRWGGNRIELTNLPAGRFTVFLYVWEDNNPEAYAIAVNGQPVVAKYNSGTTGHWERLGPWYTASKDGQIVLTSQGGAANFSGIEVWRGEYDGMTQPISDEDRAFFEKRIRPLLVDRCYDCHSASRRNCRAICSLIPVRRCVAADRKARP